MAKEILTVEIEVDLQEHSSRWSHVSGVPMMEIRNDEDEIIQIGLDGVHVHRHMTCHKLLDWKLLSRRPAE